jgi:ribosomal protein S18 acetylase RimI-like enzyme
MTARVRAPESADRAGLEAALRSDETFTPEEIGVALELIDAALSGSPDYLVRIAEAEQGGGVAGYVCYGPTPMTASTWDLYWIVVDRAARGRGVAGALLRAMEADLRARGATAVRVETSETEGYGAARALYARHAYPEAARFADFYRAGDALIVYYKRL